MHDPVLRRARPPERFAALGVDVVGISPDEPAAQLAFDEKYGLGFPLLCDTDHAGLGGMGHVGREENYGKTYVGMTGRPSSWTSAGRSRTPGTGSRADGAESTRAALEATKG